MDLIQYKVLKIGNQTNTEKGNIGYKNNFKFLYAKGSRPDMILDGLIPRELKVYIKELQNLNKA